MSFKLSKKTSLLLLSFLALFTRFIGLFWGNGYFFHPDENNIASVANSLQLPISSWSFFTKGTFSYGNFISNLAFFANLIRQKYFSNIFLINDFSFIILFIRFISAIFSSLVVLLVYKICHQFWNYKIAIISSFLVVLSPGLIQAAHFGTSEATISCLSIASLYLCLKIQQNPTGRNLIIATFLIAIATSLKINSVLILPMPFFTYFFTKKNKTSFINKTKLIVLLSILFVFIVCLLSPYYLTSSFWSMFKYERQVVSGSLVVFYTRQFINSAPILFSFLKVFPWQINPLIVMLFPCLLFLSLFKPFKNRVILLSYIFILFLPNVFYFTKWSRYLVPVLPFMIIFYVVSVEKIFNKFKNILFIVSIVSSLFLSNIFIKLYLSPDIRVQASDWMIHNLPADAKIISEAGNVVDLPVGPHNFKVVNFDFYNLDENPNLQQSLSGLLETADYIIIPSRRIFKNQTNSNFPYSQRYYQLLFGNQLGFSHLKTFSVFPSWLNYENAEETLTVFDHPTIHIFKKTKDLSLEELTVLLKI